MNDVMSAAVAGLRAATTRIGIRAHNIANVQTEGYRPLLPVQRSGPAGGPVVEAREAGLERAQQVHPGTGLVIPSVALESEFVDMILGETAYRASAKVVQTARNLNKALLDILS